MSAQVAWVSAGRTLAALLQALTLALVARSLGPAEFGHLSGVLGLATIAQTAFDLGISTFIMRERAANPSSPDIPLALRINRITSLGLLATAVGLLVAFGLLVDPVYFLMVPLALWATGERTADARLSIAYADGDVHINVANILARRTLALGLFLVGTAAFGAPLLCFCVGSAVAASLSAAYAGLYTRRTLSTAADPTMSLRGLVAHCRAYWVTSLAVQSRNVDVAITGFCATAGQAGFYSAGSRLTSPLRILPTSVASVLLPTAARVHATGRSARPLWRMVVVTLVAMSLLYALLALCMPFLVPAVLGDRYVPAVRVIQVIVAGLPFAAAVSLFSSLLQGQGRRILVARVSIVTTAGCLCLVVVGALLQGALGAAAALTATNVAQAVILGLSLRTSAGEAAHGE